MGAIKIKEKTIEYHLERKRIKNCYIAIKEGEVIVRVPTKTSQEKIEEIILKRADWIFENIKKQQKSLPKTYVDGEIFSVLGKDIVLKISYEKNAKPKLKFWLGKLQVTLPIEKKEDTKEMTQKLIEKFYAELAEKEVEKAMRKMVSKVGIAPQSYQVKNLKSTWGNCSIAGKISLSKNLVFYSRHAIEYVCLHEICHLKQMNHSKQFWAMVKKYMPNYKLAEEELKICKK